MNYEEYSGFGVFRMTGDKALPLSYDIASPETHAKREAAKKAGRQAKKKP